VHPRTKELLDHLADHRAELRRAVDAVPVERRELRPAPDRWSAAEVLEHLAIVERRVADGFASQVRAALLNADGLARGTITAPHPALGEANLYQRIAFVGGHEARHAAQIREIGAALASPGSGA